MKRFYTVRIGSVKAIEIEVVLKGDKKFEEEKVLLKWNNGIEKEFKSLIEMEVFLSENFFIQLDLSVGKRKWSDIPSYQILDVELLSTVMSKKFAQLVG